MSINALYLQPYATGDTSSQKLRVSVKTQGAESIFSALMIIQVVTSSLPPITTTTNYMTLFHAGTNVDSGLGLFLKYTNNKYYIGVRYITKNGTIWNEVPNSFVDLSLYSTNINTEPFMLLFSYNITSTTSPSLIFSIVNFGSSTLKTNPDYTLNYTFTNTNINNGGQWGFGSVPQSNSTEYGLLTKNSYNSYSSGGIYLTYLEAWKTYIVDNSSLNNTYAMFNNSYLSYSIYNIMRTNSFIPANTVNLVFQLNVPSTNISNLHNNSTNPPTLVTLTDSSTGYSTTPNFAVNNTNNYITAVQNAIACILKGMKVLTEEGYKLIEDLNLTDKLLSNDNRLLEIIDIHNFYIKPNNGNIPLIIPKGKYGAVEDLYISPGHKIKVDKKFVISCNLGLEQMKIENYKPICYYHIETKNFLEDDIIVNGVIIETYTPDDELSQLKI